MMSIVEDSNDMMAACQAYKRSVPGSNPDSEQLFVPNLDARDRVYCRNSILIGYLFTYDRFNVHGVKVAIFHGFHRLFMLQEFSTVNFLTFAREI